MAKCRYTLDVRYKSNERPWSSKYDPSPYGPATDAEAVKWTRGMAFSMGSDYDVQLLKDGEPFKEEKIIVVE